jgi:PAS domain S-box-containing protein
MYYVGIYLIDATRENAWLKAGSGAFGPKFIENHYHLPLIETSIVAWSILRGLTRVANNVFQDPLHFKNPELTDTRSEAVFPLQSRGQVIGAITVQSRDVDAFGSTEISVLQMMAAQLANAIANAHLYQESQREKRFFESMVRTSPVAIVIMDLNESILVWNPAAERLFGWRAAEVLGLRLVDLVVADEHNFQAESYRHKIFSSQPVQTITRRKRKDGKWVDVELSAILVEVEGEPTGILAIYHDITELQKAREIAESATQAKSEFLANMSHEIRTPMNAITGVTGLLLGTDLTKTQREYIETISISGDALLSLVNDVLDFSKIEAGKLELEMDEFDLSLCIESALDVVVMQDVGKNIDLAYRIGPGVPMKMVGDQLRLRQVLINLLYNGVKFTDEGEVVVNVSAQAVDESELYDFHFEVRDSGIGIKPDKMDLLFQSFSQIGSSTSRMYGGTGLGLAISKQLVELMGGKIWVESSGVDGEGSVFHFTIQALGPQIQDGPPILVEEKFRGKQIVLGMPDRSSRRIVQDLLSGWGMHVKFKDTPESIGNLIQQNKDIDIFIIDESIFPVGNGFTISDFYVYLRELLPHVRIITLINVSQREIFDTDELIVTKPVKPKALFEAVQRALSSQIKINQNHKKSNPSYPVEKIGKDISVLLVEDHAVNQRVFSMLMDRMGIGFEIVSSGDQAVKIINEKQIDIIFMDVHMPGMDGVETTRQIRSQLKSDQPYIIAMTADEKYANDELLENIGMNAYISKPVYLGSLQEVLSKAAPTMGNHDSSNSISDVKQTARDESLIEVDPSVIDVDSLFGYFPQSEQDDFDALKKMIELFCDEYPARINELQMALDCDDYELGRKAAHTIKGAGLTFGAVRLSKTAKDLEEALLAQNNEDIDRFVEMLEREYTMAIVELLRMVAQS